MISLVVEDSSNAENTTVLPGERLSHVNCFMAMADKHLFGKSVADSNLPNSG